MALLFNELYGEGSDFGGTAANSTNSSATSSTTATAPSSGASPIGGFVSSITSPVANVPGPFGLNLAPSPLGLLSMAVPGPVGIAMGIVNAVMGIEAPAVNSLGQSQVSGFGNQSVDAFGNPVGSPENVASVASYSPDTGSFTSSTGETMAPAANPDVSTPNDYGASADQSQAADPSGVTGDTYGESTASGGGGGGAGKVICTELHLQGKLDDATMAADREFGRAVRDSDPYTMIGYHVLALPIVRLMKKSNIVTNAVALLALPWAKEMYFKQTGEGKGSYRGRILMSLGIPLCRKVGRSASRVKQYAPKYLGG
jgi:hypothetical protein